VIVHSIDPAADWIEALPTAWRPEEWATLHATLADLSRAAGWSAPVLARALSGGKRLLVRRRPEADDHSALTRVVDGGRCCVELYDRCFDGSRGRYPDRSAYARGTIVHELAHVWDIESGLLLSDRMRRATGSEYVIEASGQAHYHPAGGGEYGGATKCGHLSHEEDFAEAVAAFVYGPGYDQGQGRYVDRQRLAYVARVMAQERDGSAARAT